MPESHPGIQFTPPVKRRKAPQRTVAPRSDVRSGSGGRSGYSRPAPRRQAAPRPYVRRAPSQQTMDRRTRASRPAAPKSRGLPVLKPTDLRPGHHIAPPISTAVQLALHGLTGQRAQIPRDVPIRTNVPVRYNGLPATAHDLGKLIDAGLKGVTGGVYGGHRSKTSRRAGGATVTGVSLAAGPNTAAQIIAQETAFHPGKTLKGFGQIATAAPAAIGSLVADTASGTAHGDPLRGVKHFVSSAWKDYKRRYGPAFAGTPEGRKQFRDRLRKEGTAAELLDIASGVTVGGAAGGRAVTALARTGQLGERAQKVATEARPALRVSGGHVRPQQIHPNFFKAAAQKGIEDRLRQRAFVRRQAKGAKRDEAPRGMVPQRRGPNQRVRFKNLTDEGLSRRMEATSQQMKELRQRVDETEKIIHSRSIRDPHTGLSHMERDFQDVPARVLHGRMQLEALAQEMRVMTEEFRGRQATGPRQEVVALTRGSQARQIRLRSARTQSQGYLKLRNELDKELRQGFDRDVLELPRAVRPAVFHLVQGLVDPTNKERAVAQLKARRARIVKTAERRGHKVPTSRSPFGSELAAIDYLVSHADKVFGGENGKVLARFRARQAARAKRLEAGDVELRAGTAEARRLQPQAREIGVKSDYESARAALARRDRRGKKGVVEARRQLEERKPELNRRFVKQVRKERVKHGLTEPGFVAHFENTGLTKRSDFSPGTGARKGVGRSKRSEFSLLDTGRADVGLHAARRSIARAVKRPVNWDLVARQVDDHALRIDPAEAKKILAPKGGRKIDVDKLDPHDLEKIARAKGLNRNDWVFINPGLIRRGREGLGESVGEATDSPELGSQQVSAALSEAKVEGDPKPGYAYPQGYRLVPKPLADELERAAAPSGVAGRMIGKAQGFQSRILLGTSPSWLAFQVAANTLQAGLGVRGNPVSLVKGQMLYRRLSSGEKETVDQALGQGPYAASGAHARLGAASESDIVNWVRKLSDSPFAQHAKNFNPLDLIFRFDDAQNKFFKRGVLYDRMRRQAYKDMGASSGKAFAHQQRIAGVLNLGPVERMREMVHQPDLFEQHAGFVDDVLGDYTRFTARERRYLKRGILFYGFLRYSLRTLFYTLPVKHPIVMAVTGKLAQLHIEEVKELLGGDQAPWAYSRILFEKDGKIRSVDLARLNPVTNQLVDAVTEGPKAFAQFMTPAAQAVMDQIYNKSAFTGRPLRVSGQTTEAKLDTFDVRRAAIFANDLLSTAFPYRLAKAATQKGSAQNYTDDSLLFSPQRIKYKTSDAIDRATKRDQEAGRFSRQALQQLLPLFFPKADDKLRDQAKGTKPGGWSGGSQKAAKDHPDDPAGSLFGPKQSKSADDPAGALFK